MYPCLTHNIHNSKTPSNINMNGTPITVLLSHPGKPDMPENKLYYCYFQFKDILMVNYHQHCRAAFSKMRKLHTPRAKS